MDFPPKTSQRVADRIVRHFREDLRERGIVVNREVQIRRGIGDRTGQRVDIYADAITQVRPGAIYGQIHTITEVKGNWNKELRTAMEAPLRDRYLERNPCRNGLYLVAWFASPKWSDSDSRKRTCPRISLNEAQEAFAHQADELSKDGCRIRSYVLDVTLSE